MLFLWDNQPNNQYTVKPSTIKHNLTQQILNSKTKTETKTGCLPLEVVEADPHSASKKWLV